MTQRIRKAEPSTNGDGYRVTIEVTNAYTDGSSRFEEVFVPRAAFVGKTLAEKRQAVADALDMEPFAEAQDALATAPAVTKDILEARMVTFYERWLRWQTTRIEAQARSVPANVITSLTNKENSSWDAYASAILAWRAAP